MSRFKPLDVVYAKFPYGGVETTDAHPVLILKTISDSNGNEFAVVAAGTCAVDKYTYEIKHSKRRHEIMVSGDLLNEAGLTFPTYFKFNPMVLEDGKMIDGSVITISLDDRFLAIEPKTKRTKLGSLPLSDARILSQYKEASQFVDLDKAVAKQVEYFSVAGFSYLRKPNPLSENSKETVKDNLNKIRNNNKFKLPKSFVKKP